MSCVLFLVSTGMIAMPVEAWWIDWLAGALYGSGITLLWSSGEKEPA